MSPRPSPLFTRHSPLATRHLPLATRRFRSSTETRNFLHFRQTSKDLQERQGKKSAQLARHMAESTGEVEVRNKDSGLGLWAVREPQYAMCNPKWRRDSCADNSSPAWALCCWHARPPLPFGGRHRAALTFRAKRRTRPVCRSRRRSRHRSGCRVRTSSPFP
jgi:hypothetical protein